jgi:hypothetical protein
MRCQRPLLAWPLAAFALAFVVGIVAVYIGLDINKDNELCEAAAVGARSLVTLGGIPCNLNPGAILTHFAKYFLLVYAPLMAPTVIYVAAAGVCAALRWARSGNLGTGR